MVHRRVRKAWIVRNDGIRIGLPCECRGARQLGATRRAGRGVGGAVGRERDRTDGLIELVENVDLSGVRGVGIGECRGIRDRIDGNALSGLGKAAEIQVGTPVENGSARSGATGSAVQSIVEGCAAGDVDGEDAVEVRIGRGVGGGDTGNQHGRGDSGDEPGERTRGCRGDDSLRQGDVADGY